MACEGAPAGAPLSPEAPGRDNQPLPHNGHSCGRQHGPNHNRRDASQKPVLPAFVNLCVYNHAEKMAGLLPEFPTTSPRRTPEHYEICPRDQPLREFRRPFLPKRLRQESGEFRQTTINLPQSNPKAGTFTGDKDPDPKPGGTKCTPCHRVPLPNSCSLPPPG